MNASVMPRILGLLLILMGAGFAANLLDTFLVPRFYPALFAQGALGGLPTMFWLAIKGVRAG